MNTEVEGVIAWYKGLSDEIKNFWAFRWVRMQDTDYKLIYETMKAAEKLCKRNKKNERQN